MIVGEKKNKSWSFLIRSLSRNHYKGQKWSHSVIQSYYTTFQLTLCNSNGKSSFYLLVFFLANYVILQTTAPKICYMFSMRAFDRFQKFTNQKVLSLVQIFTFLKAYQSQTSQLLRFYSTSHLLVFDQEYFILHIKHIFKKNSNLLLIFTHPPLQAITLSKATSTS